MRLLSAPTAPLDLITRAQLSAANVAEFGAVPNDPSKAAINDAAFAAALASGRAVVYVPEGTWWVSFEIYLPDFMHFKGSGMGKTIIKMVNGSAQGLNVVTNQHNDRQVRANYNRDIRISDMTIDRNAETSVEGSGGMAAGALTSGMGSGGSAPTNMGANPYAGAAPQSQSMQYNPSQYNMGQGLKFNGGY